MKQSLYILPLLVLSSLHAAPTGFAPVDESALNKSVKPCDDFYHFACGGWLKTAEIPPDRPSWSRGFVAVHEQNLLVMKGLLEQYAKKPDPKDKDTKKLGDYYAVCMDEKKAETASLKELEKHLKEIDALTGVNDLAPLLARLHLEGVNAFFDFDSFQDFKDSSQMIGAVDQAGLTLPDRDYYLSDKGKMPEIRKLFEQHIVKMLGLLKVTKVQAQKQAKIIFKIEKDLAQASMSRVDRREPENIYHRLERKGLKEKAPHFNWDAYFVSLGYPQAEQINVLTPSFIVEFNKLTQPASLEEIKTYLRWHFLMEATPTLGKAFVNEQFRFTSKAFGGEKEILPRWKRCVNSADSALSHPLGRAFVKATFGEEGKEEARSLIKNIEESMQGLLKNLSWMDTSTRKEALEKLKRIANQVGYPDKWRNFDLLEVDHASYLANRLRANAFNVKYELDKIGKPVDRLEWHMSPPTVNAYYSEDNNQMVFPAGILQPPYFHRSAPLAANYGGIGMVMGHEITHGFDDEGKKRDSMGNLRDWWTPSALKEFNKHAECMVKQYNQYVPIDDLHLNGKLTLGENIADQGGLKLAYEAYQAAKKNESDTGPNTGKYTEDQQFFIAFAQTWCSKRRPELERMLVTVDPHSPAEFRVNGSISNFPQFGKVFGCPAASRMVPKSSCAVW